MTPAECDESIGPEPRARRTDPPQLEEFTAAVRKAFDVEDSEYDAFFTAVTELRRLKAQRLHAALSPILAALSEVEAALSAIVNERPEPSFSERHFRTTEPAEPVRLTCSQDP